MHQISKCFTLAHKNIASLLEQFLKKYILNLLFFRFLQFISSLLELGSTICVKIGLIN